MITIFLVAAAASVSPSPETFKYPKGVMKYVNAYDRCMMSSLLTVATIPKSRPLSGEAGFAQALSMCAKDRSEQILLADKHLARERDYKEPARRAEALEKLFSLDYLAAKYAGAQFPDYSSMTRGAPARVNHAPNQ